MIGYTTVGTRDMTKAKAFYTELLGLLGAKLVIDMGRLALFGTGRGKPMFGVCLPTFYGAYVRDPDGNKLAFFKMT